jgi:hypothetical protein
MSVTYFSIILIISINLLIRLEMSESKDITNTSDSTNTDNNDKKTDNVKTEKPTESEETHSKQIEKLLNNMSEFIFQTYSGVLISYIRLIKDDTSNHIDESELFHILNVLLKKYLNMCYHSYYNNSDGYVINNFNTIINIDVCRNEFREIASIGYKQICSIIKEFKGCSDHCNNEEYDGEDIFIFSS